MLEHVEQRGILANLTADPSRNDHESCILRYFRPTPMDLPLNIAITIFSFIKLRLKGVPVRRVIPHFPHLLDRGAEAFNDVLQDQAAIARLRLWFSILRQQRSSSLRVKENGSGWATSYLVSHG